MKENREVTDANVGDIENSIEEDIKQVKDLMKELKEERGDIQISRIQHKLRLSVNNILSDYKRVLKENEQLSTEVNSLKEENEKYKNAVNVVNKEKADWIKAYQEEKDLKENYIQKVKNKMEKDIKTNEHTILGRRNGKTLEYGRRLGRIEMCKELLEGEK